MFNPKEKIVYNEKKKLYECYLRMKPGIWVLFGIGNNSESASQTADYWSADIPDEQFISKGDIDKGTDKITFNTKSTIDFFYNHSNRIFDKKTGNFI